MAIESSVCVVIVTYGDRLRLCAESVDKAIAGGASHVIVVDNGSTIKNKLPAAEYFSSNSSITVISQPVNLGSSGGVLLGINEVIKRDETYVLFLDDDNFVGRNTIALAVDHFERKLAELQNSLVIIACRRLSNKLHGLLASGHSPSDVYPPGGSFLSFDLYQRIKRKCFPKRRYDNSDKSGIIIPHSPYGGLLIRNSTLANCPMPNLELKLYEDDTAWTYSLSKMGYQIFLSCDSVIEDADGKWQDGGGSSGPLRMLESNSSIRLYYSVRNRVHFDRSRLFKVSDHWRYKINRLIYMAYIFLAGRSKLTFKNREIMREAIMHGESGTLEYGPDLGGI